MPERWQRPFNLLFKTIKAIISETLRGGNRGSWSMVQEGAVRMPGTNWVAAAAADAAVSDDEAVSDDAVSE